MQLLIYLIVSKDLILIKLLLFADILLALTAQFVQLMLSLKYVSTLQYSYFENYLMLELIPLDEHQLISTFINISTVLDL